MASSIVYELFNLTVATPTGMATYARNLTDAARKMGYEVDGLFHTFLALNTKDEILTEVGFFDARNQRPSFVAKYIELLGRRLIGAPTGLNPTRLPRTGVVINSG